MQKRPDIQQSPTTPNADVKRIQLRVDRVLVWDNPEDLTSLFLLQGA